MRDLGRKGGKSRRRGAGEQLPAAEALSLRETLRSGLDHELVKAAIEQALAGGNESARVAAVKFLADLELYRKDGDDCPVCAKVKAEAPFVRAKLERLLESRVKSHKLQLDKEIEPVVAFITEQYAASGGVVPFDVNAEQAAAIFSKLEESGVIRRGSETLAEERAALARERAELAAQRAEFNGS